MIRTADPLFFNPTIGERCQAMRTMLAHQPVIGFFIAIDDQLLAKNFYRSDRFVFGQFRGSRYGVPITAQQLAARRATADLSQQFVFSSRQHSLNLPSM